MKDEMEFGYDSDGMPLDLVDIMSAPWGVIADWDDYMLSQCGDDL